MKERGFLVPQHEAKALQEGRQTQFRRIIKPQPPSWAEKGTINQFGRWDFGGRSATRHQISCGYVCPYGQAGDRLWVREAFIDTNSEWNVPVIYKADGTIPFPGWKWRPSVHMTRGESRFTREITNIRVERVRDISEEDAIVEGVRRVFFQGVPWFYHTESGGPSFETAIEAYAALWGSIHGEGVWARDDWTWVLSTLLL